MLKQCLDEENHEGPSKQWCWSPIQGVVVVKEKHSQQAAGGGWKPWTRVRDSVGKPPSGKEMTDKAGPNRLRLSD